MIIARVEGFLLYFCNKNEHQLTHRALIEQMDSFETGWTESGKFNKNNNVLDGYRLPKSKARQFSTLGEVDMKQALDDKISPVLADHLKT